MHCLELFLKLFRFTCFCRKCEENALNPSLVKDKIVLCHVVSDGSTPFYAGAIGAIMADDSPHDFASSFPLSASHLSNEDGDDISLYINTTRYLYSFSLILCWNKFSFVVWHKIEVDSHIFFMFTATQQPLYLRAMSKMTP